MDAVLRASLFLGAVLLLGAGLFSRWVGPGLGRRDRLRLGLALGGTLVMAASLAEIALTVDSAFGGFDAAVYWDYLLYTRHGQATLARLGFTLSLFFLGLGWLALKLERLGWVLSGLGLLASIAWVSHGGTLGALPFLGDLLHLTGASLWAGALLYLAWVPAWTEDGLKRAVARVSTLGLAGVAILTLTGVYASVLHLYGISAFTTTSYGLALVVKLLLVLSIVGLAAINRWWLLPKLMQGHSSGLRRAVRVEAVLLVAVLGVTGVLTTREPPHDHSTPHDHTLASITAPTATAPTVIAPATIAP